MLFFPQYVVFSLTVIDIIMNLFSTDLSRIQVCFIVSIVQREIISMSIEMSIEILLFDTHR